MALNFAVGFGYGMPMITASSRLLSGKSSPSLILPPVTQKRTLPSEVLNVLNTSMSSAWGIPLTS